MRWLDATEVLLNDAETPMHYGELARDAIARDLVQTKSKTPHITLHTVVSADVRGRESRGQPPRFTIGKGMVGLAEWEAGPSDEARRIIDRTRGRAGRELLSKLRQLTGDEFESFLEVLLTKMGYNVTVTGGRDDDGIDLIAELSGGAAPQRVGIQAKCLGPRREVGPNTVRLLRDALGSNGCNAGAIVTTTRINDQARSVAEEAGKPPVSLIDGRAMSELALEHLVGIEAEPLRLYREDLTSVFEIEEEPPAS